MNQTLISQRGEIEFRKKLVEFQVNRKSIIDNELSGGDIEEVLKERMLKTVNDICGFEFELSPYVELGAERCQRSLVMENDLGVNGAAIDISFDMLRSCDYYSRLFNKKNLPLRICCDISRLPFKDGSIPFMFCYQTLHHFPNLSPVMKEIHRVVADGGVFYFNEEPYKQKLHLGLYDSELYTENSIHANNLMKLINHFFARKHCNETDYGIVENNEIKVGEWQKAVSDFDSSISLQSLKYITATPNQILKYFFVALLGGIVKGVCRKRGKNGGVKSIYDALMCIVCGGDLDKNYSCLNCYYEYPVKNNVIFLFEPNKFIELYG